MSDKKQSRRSARDRRPNEVPHHPKLMTTAMIIAIVAVVVMAGWCWVVISGQTSIFASGHSSAWADYASVAQSISDTSPLQG